MECIAMSQGDRIRTFIHGFDDKLGGGIPEGHVVLLAGEPGTMKSTIAFNMIYQNALRDGRPGTYISLEQGRENLTRHLDQMSLSPRDVENKVSSEDLGKNGEEYLSDGIIHTKMERVDDANIQRRIRCVKLRGTNHSPNYYTLIFQSGILQATRIIAE